ncbi:MAG: cytochrome P460 family protein [Acidobacteriota bacterium]
MKYVLPVLLALAAALVAQQPRFTSDGQLQRPANYREWIYLSTGLGMTYSGDRPNPNQFDNVFAEPTAYREFLKTGKWPEGSMLALELRRAQSKGSINADGHYQGEFVAVEVTVKDSKRFKDKNGWAYFGFSGTRTTAAAFDEKAGCNACHSKNAAVENTFVQFYPTLLEVARAKGTLRPSYAQGETH